MFCSNCGKKIADGSKFCSGCGAKLEETEAGETNAGKSEKAEKQASKIPVAAQTYFEQGEKYQKKGDYQNAYSSYKSAIGIAPDFWEAHKKSVEILLISKDTDRAYKIINNVISKNPDDYEAYLLRGKVYHLTGNTEKALIDYEIALKLKPDDLEIYKALILTYKTLKDFDNIIEITSKVIKIAPNDYSLYYSRGLAYFYKDLYDNAISDYSKSLEIKPDSTESLSDTAAAYYQKKDYENALIYINRFFEKIPDNADCAILRGKIYFHKEDFEKAIKDFDFVVKYYGENTNPEVYKLRAISRYKSGYYKKHGDEILKDFRILHEFVPYKELVFFKEIYIERHKTGYYLKHKGEIRKDYLDLCELMPKNELDFFKDIMLERYKKAIFNFKNEKKTYLIMQSSKSLWDGLYTKWEDYLTNSSIHDPRSVHSSNKGALVFIDQDFASSYCSILGGNRGSKTVGFKTTNNIKEGTPKYWFITHAKAGYKFFKNGSSEQKIKWGFFDDDPGYKYESLEDALKDYERIINSEHLCNEFINDKGKVESKVFTWRDNYNTYSSDNFMDIFIVGLGGTEEINENNAADYVNKGDSYLRKEAEDDEEYKNKYKLAIIEYTKAIKIDSSFSRAYMRRGDANMILKEYNKAITDFTTAISIDPDDTTFYCRRANTYELLNDYNKAIDDYNKAISIDPDDAEFYHSRSIVYVEKKELDKALIDLKKAVELDMSYNQYLAEFYEERASEYLGNGDIEKAVENFTAAVNSYESVSFESNKEDILEKIQILKNNEDADFIHLSRSEVYMSKKEFDKAKIEIEKAVKISSANRYKLVSFYNKRAQEYFDNGDFKKAIEYLTSGVNYFKSINFANGESMLLDSIKELKNMQKSKVEFGKDEKDDNEEDEDESSFIQDLNKGNEYFKSENYNQAVNLLSKAINEYNEKWNLPDEFAYAYLKFATARYMIFANNSDKYINNNNEITDKAAFLNLIDDIKKAIEYNQEVAFLYHLISISFYLLTLDKNDKKRQEYFDNSMKYIDKAIELDPNDDDSKNARKELIDGNKDCYKIYKNN